MIQIVASNAQLIVKSLVEYNNNNWRKWWRREGASWFKVYWAKADPDIY